MTGESCVPAIVTDDVYSIFEEQEIVSSLADSMTSKNKDDPGAGKIEKLAVGKVVYAEAEKMLAFGPVSCAQMQGSCMYSILFDYNLSIMFKVVELWNVSVSPIQPKST